MRLQFYLFWIFSHHFYLAYSDRNSEKMGPYDIVDVSGYHCEDDGTKEFDYTIKTKKISKTAFAFTFNITLTNRTIGDNLRGSVVVDQFTNGGWKPGYLQREFPKLCSTIKRFFPETIKPIYEQMKQDKYEECNFPPGFYEVKEVQLADLQLKELPVFFYNKYRLNLNILEGDVKIGCLCFQGTFVPKKRKRN